MKIFFLGFLLVSGLCVRAQVPEDALRLSWMNPSGSARQQAIGGAMGSLGGEVSTMFVNPAGLAFYKTSELVLSPGFQLLKDNSQFIGNKMSGSNVSRFNLGTSAFVFGQVTSPTNSNAFAIGVNQTANFNSDITYQGKNSNSSGAEQYAEEFAASGLNINDALSSPSLSYGTRMALYTYLVDTATSGGNTNIIAQPEKVLSGGGYLNQLNHLHTSGGITEIGLSVAGNYSDKWYIGATIGVPIVNYRRALTYTETDGSGNNNNDFGAYSYQETFTSKGVGVNVKLGAIFRPSADWRVGLAIQTPTFYSLTDRIHAKLVANTENYNGTDSLTSDELDAQTGSYNAIKYELQSPWKFLVSGTYFFGTGEDTKQQKGFITGDVEYVTVKSARFHVPSDDDGDYTDNSYYDGLNNTVKHYYKNNLNFRVGAEMKFNTLAARAGFAYSLTPYAQNDFKANRMYISGGLGYRNKGVFVDLTYVEGIVKDADFPYRLADKPNVVASVKQLSGTVVMTVGFKF